MTRTKVQRDYETRTYSTSGKWKHLFSIHFSFRDWSQIASPRYFLLILRRCWQWSSGHNKTIGIDYFFSRIFKITFRPFSFFIDDYQNWKWRLNLRWISSNISDEAEEFVFESSAFRKWLKKLFSSDFLQAGIDWMALIMLKRWYNATHLLIDHDSCSMSDQTPLNWSVWKLKLVQCGSCLICLFSSYNGRLLKDFPTTSVALISLTLSC